MKIYTYQFHSVHCTDIQPDIRKRLSDSHSYIIVNTKPHLFLMRSRPLWECVSLFILTLLIFHNFCSFLLFSLYWSTHVLFFILYWSTYFPSFSTLLFLLLLIRIFSIIFYHFIFTFVDPHIFFSFFTALIHIFSTYFLSFFFFIFT